MVFNKGWLMEEINQLCEGSDLRTCVLRSLTEVNHCVFYHSFCLEKSIAGAEVMLTSNIGFVIDIPLFLY